MSTTVMLIDNKKCKSEIKKISSEAEVEAEAKIFSQPRQRPAKIMRGQRGRGHIPGYRAR